MLRFNDTLEIVDNGVTNNTNEAKIRMREFEFVFLNNCNERKPCTHRAKGAEISTSNGVDGNYP